MIKIVQLFRKEGVAAICLSCSLGMSSLYAQQPAAQVTEDALEASLELEEAEEDSLASQELALEEFTETEEDSLYNYVSLPESTYEYVPDLSYDDIADRYACMQAEVYVPFNRSVKGFIDYFTIRDREYTKKVLAKSPTFFPLFEKYLRKHNMPTDLKYLSVVESGLNPQAISRVGAAGLWQFMPATGRIYRLNRNWYIDERMDPEKATEAACLYLKQLYGMFDDWQLALAAYNAGPGNVRKAIRRSGYKKDFWEVYRYLPRETRAYVPQFAAVMYVMEHLEDHNLLLEETEFAPVVAADTVHMPDFISLSALEQQLNLCPGEIESLNPELARKAIPEDAGRYALRVPTHASQLLREQRMAIYDSTASQNKELLAYFKRNETGSTYGRERVVYRVRSGDYLGRIASRHGVSVSDLRHWNRLRGNQIYAGQKLSVWVKAGTQGVPGSSPVIQSGGKYYTVQPGDTLWEISKKRGVSVATLRQLNGISGSNIKVGQKLILSK